VTLLTCMLICLVPLEVKLWELLPYADTQLCSNVFMEDLSFSYLLMTGPCFKGGVGCTSNT